ncbi:MAG: NAD(P)H-hydrate epimerase, partial [Saprospiraceae bacterium]|nr:NAD(P)H-hydrate epimerase [Saprospiraceae bacterium]
MKVFSATQIRAWDQYTIENEPIASANLMRRAAKVFFDWFTQCYSDTRQPILIIAGTGNNGGDGIAVARLLDMAQYTAKVIVCDFGTRHSPDFDLQMAEFPTNSAVECRICTSVTAFESAFNDFSGSEPVVIDALFGTGLNRVLSGDWLKVVEHINQAALEIASIDVPTGLLADEHTPGNAVIKAARTFTFQAPKKAFFFAENAERVGEWSVGDIGLHAAFSELTPTLVHFFTADDARHLFKPRKKFAHKGTFGHALLICGSYGKMGAAVLSARACLRSGAGLVTVHAPRSGNIILQTAVPEAMFQADKAEEVWTTVPEKINYQAVGIGPGIGRAPETALAMAATLAQFRQPMVLDADALNLISEHPEILKSIPPHSILTPHPKEFERLFGASA